MIDYNEFLSNEEKVKFLQAKIETEKSKLSAILCEEKDISKHLAVLEEYFVALKEINETHSIPMELYE